MPTTDDTFLNSYIECALWSIPFDDSRSAVTELADETKQRMRLDCQSFREQADTLMDAAGWHERQEQIAHDFWLTRNGHGAGFWDGDYPEPLDQQLTRLARSFGQCDLSIGDDNKIYIS